MKAAIYTRISSDSQEEGTSLDSQQEACLARANELGYEVTEQFREVRSGLTLERPILEQLRELVRNKSVDAVIAYCLDRLSRDPVHFILLQDEIQRSGAELILVSEDLDNSDMGKLIGHIKGYSAKLEALKIRERCLRGLKERAKSGRLVGGRSVHLYGYVYEFDELKEKKGRRLINEQQAEIARDIFKWLAEGETINGVVYRLNELGIETPTGKSRWNSSTVHKILTNPAYIGKPKPYHGIVVLNSTPALISEELFAQVQTRLKNNAKQSSRNAKVEYLLRGHIRCVPCFRRYFASTVHGRERYYYCSGRLKMITSHKCHNKSYKADELENIVWSQVEELLTRPEVILSELERRKDDTSQLTYIRELADIEERLVDLDRQQRELLQWALRGFPEDAITKENERINQYRETLKSRKAQLEASIAEINRNELDLTRAGHFCALARENLANFTYTDKRLALEALQIEVLVDGQDISITGAVPLCEIVSTPLKPGHGE
ncbi:recombinase family protein [Chloroflexota bacterium]